MNGQHGLPRRPVLLGARALTFALLIGTAALAAWSLGLSLDGLVPRPAGREILGQLARAALSPAVDYENGAPAGAAPFLVKVLHSLGSTLLYAAAAMSLALPAGLLLGVLSSEAFWGRGASARQRSSARAARWSLRTFSTLLRSVHELLWAVLLLAALGLAPASAVFAIAIPFAGTLAKVTSELLDEAPQGAFHALEGLGAGRAAALTVGLVPVAFADLSSYAFYRLECAVRSAAVLGFFGAPTVGSYVAQSFENLQLREMWTYLYGLILLVLVMEWLGARLRSSLR